jgi:multiple sugar transport system permease protein
MSNNIKNTDGGSVSDSPEVRRKIKRVSYAKYGYIFILPFFLIYFTFSLYPLLSTISYSFSKNVATQRNSYVAESVGLKNYQQLLFKASADDPELARATGFHTAFWQSLGNTFLIWLMNFFPQIILSLLLAAWFTDATLKIKGKGFFKIVMYLPNILTAASIAVLGMKLFGNTELSAVNNVLMDWGWIKEPILFLQDISTKRMVIAGIQIWMWFGNTMILLMAGIAGINPSLFEAANIDGASGPQIFTKITLPLLRPILLFTLITSMIGGMQIFDIPFLYNAGVDITPGTKTMAILILETYQKDAVPNTGHSGAISVLLFVLTSIMGIIVFYINRDKDEIAYKKHLKKLRKQAQSGTQKHGGGLTV